MKNFLSRIASGILAGIMISIGGAIYLASENKVIGAIMFCVGLISVCYKGCYLFTGRVCFLLDKHTKGDISDLLLGLLGNFLGTLLIGLIVKNISNLSIVASTACAGKLAFSWWQWLLKGIMCGMLMYLAVSIFSENNKNPIGILFCIPTFILAGFEHSIADMFYFAVGGFTLDSVWFLLIVVLGNAIGGVFLPALKKIVELRK